jgi:hypothetical protein
MNQADFAATSAWAGVQGKPDSFPPSVHSHKLVDLSQSGAELDQVVTWTGKKWEARDSGVRNLRVESERGFAEIKETVELIADEQGSLASRFVGISTRFDSATADYEQRITALSREGEESVESLESLTARLGTAESTLKRVDKVATTDVSALSQTTIALSSRFEGTEATIEQIYSTYATKLFAEAKRSEAIFASAGDATAKVLVETEARADADGSIHAKWGVSIDGNGRIIGRVNLDGANGTSEFSVLATTFEVSDAGTSLPVFTISGGKVKFTGDVEIDGSLLVGTLNAVSITAATINGTGTKIIVGGTVDDTIADMQVVGEISAREFGAGTPNAGITATVAGGTDSSPTITKAGSFAALRMRGYDGTAYASGASVRLKAASDWGTMANDTEMEVVVGTATTNAYFYFSKDQVLEFGSARDTNLYRSSANILKTDDDFEAASVTATGIIKTSNGAGEQVQMGTVDGYGFVEVGGDSGGFVDLKAPDSDDYDLRIIADASITGVLTATGLDLLLLPGAGGYVKFGVRESGSYTVGGRIPIKDESGTIRYLLCE